MQEYLNLEAELCPRRGRGGGLIRVVTPSFKFKKKTPSCLVGLAMQIAGAPSGLAMQIALQLQVQWYAERIEC